MNIITIKHKTLLNILSRPFHPSTAIKYANISQLSLNNFIVTAEPEKQNDMVYVGFGYEFMDIADIGLDAMPDYKGEGKIIKYTNFFEKKNANDKLTGRVISTDMLTDVFEAMSLYIHPQSVIKNGEQYIDLYAEQANDYPFNNFNTTQKMRRIMFAINLLDYVESRLRKERRKIKRIMPTPERMEQIRESKESYKSQPIVIKDISVQYVYEPHETRKYMRHCEAWNVRGHYRHYKSGKVIYVKPHAKGNGKQKTTVYKFEQ